jgi:hypothetical protein
MKRKQIYITEELDGKIKEIAYVKKTTESAIIREALEEYICSKKKKNVDNVDNPLLNIIGLGESGKKDISLNHDQYLYKTEI